MSADLESKREKLLDKLEAMKDDVAKHFNELGLGKDLYLRVVEAIDGAKREVLIAPLGRGDHDLNDELAKKPEDHPAVVGQGDKPDIQLDDPKSAPEGAYQSPEAPASAKDPDLPGNKELAKQEKQAEKAAKK